MNCMRRLAFGLTSVTIVAAALAAHTLAQGKSDGGGGTCPDTKATQVDARVAWSGEVTRCGVGVGIFGIRLGLFGPRCPEAKYYYPSHQTCQGAPNAGSYCVVTGTLPVERHDCECAEATVLGTGILVPSCECKNAGPDGHVEDAETRPCPDWPTAQEN